MIISFFNHQRHFSGKDGRCVVWVPSDCEWQFKSNIGTVLLNVAVFFFFCLFLLIQRKPDLHPQVLNHTTYVWHEVCNFLWNFFNTKTATVDWEPRTAIQWKCWWDKNPRRQAVKCNELPKNHLEAFVCYFSYCNEAKGNHNSIQI